jgi:hypothetical protein
LWTARLIQRRAFLFKNSVLIIIMSEEIITQPTTLDLVTAAGANINVTGNDLIAISISGTEDAIAGELEATVKLAKTRRKEYEVLEKATKKQVTDLAHADFKDKFTRVDQSLQAMLNYRLGNPVKDGKFGEHVHFSDMQSRTEIHYMVMCSIQEHPASGGVHNRGSLCIENTITTPGDIISGLKAGDAISDEIVELDARAAELRRNLARIPYMERKARANMAAAVLSSSADGRALLDRVTGEGRKLLIDVSRPAS